MAANLIMLTGTVIFAILCSFLLFIFTTSIVSFFKSDKKENYEPNITAVIPCYNEEKNIGKCLDSLYSLEYQKNKIEVIVVDDGSTDDTKKTLKEYKKKYPKLIIINGKHEGKSMSLNKGVKKSSNNFIFSLDADTLIEKTTLKKMVQPMLDPKVGATNGSCIARNKDSFLGIFQNLEYHYNNLIRKSLSTLFNNGIWFFGAFACYRKEVLKKIGYFKTDTLTEDTDTALEIYAAGYRTLNIHDAYGYVSVPSTLKGFINQRTRWWIGVLQSLKKNKKLFSLKSSPSILFLFLNQYWWSFYAIASLPLIAYQFSYWLPSDNIFMYTFRWFTLTGPFYVIYKTPEWGISLYSIFGVLSGIISFILILQAICYFKEKLGIKQIFGIFFYFPYTIVLNTIIIISLVKIMFLKKRYFIY